MKPVETLLLDFGPGNALSRTNLRRLLQRLRRLERSSEVRVIVLVSRQNAVFSSGLALRELTAHGRFAAAWSVVSAVWLVRRVVGRLLRSPKIIVSVLRGGVIGSAVSIALACDGIFADTSAWFWLPDPVYGGLLADGGLDLLCKRAGWSTAQRMCLSSQRVGARQAMEMGLVHSVEEPEHLECAVQRHAEKLCRLSDHTLRETKRLLARGVLTHFPLLSLLRIVCSKEMRRRTRAALRLPPL